MHWKIYVDTPFAFCNSKKIDILYSTTKVEREVVHSSRYTCDMFETPHFLVWRFSVHLGTMSTHLKGLRAIFNPHHST